MPAALRYLFLALVVLHYSVVADRTALNCTTITYVNATALISTAGQYDVSCAGFSEWYVWVFGCASNSTDGVVSIRLLNSPTQVRVSDDATLFIHSAAGLNATLAGCSVDITYLTDTAVPSDATFLPVYVSSTSFMGNISVVLLATLYLERAFIAILGNKSGGIESIALRCDQGSSIVCRRAANNSYRICSPSLGTSLIVLAPGCPQIGALSVLLNGTNVTGSMWLGTMSDFTSPSSFSFVFIDNSSPPSVTLAPKHNSIVLTDVLGLMVLPAVLVVRTMVPAFPVLLNAYNMSQGSVEVINCKIVTDPLTGNPIFWFDNVATLQIVLINVSSTGYLINVLLPNTGDVDNISTSGPSSAIRLHIADSSMRFTEQFLSFGAHNLFGGTVLCRNVLSMTAENSVFMLDGAEGTVPELLRFYSYSASLSLPPLLMTVSILFSKCTVNATLNSAQLLNTLSTNQAQPPILDKSSIVFEDSQVYQTYKTYVSYFGTVTPPVPLIQADLNATTIVFSRCNIFVQQVSSPTTPAVALLLSVTNAMITSSLHFINSSIAVAANTTWPLRTFPISVNAMSSSNITFINTTLTNLLALVQLLNTSSPLNHNPIIDVGCSNSWCALVDNRPCAPVA
ncbi:Hypothetical protein, putative, partial [Bodo saltans]